MQVIHRFLGHKKRVFAPTVERTTPNDIHPALFPFQRDLVAWAVRSGRAALFADALVWVKPACRVAEWAPGWWVCRR